MDNDQEVAVIFQLNLNERKRNSSWEGSLHDETHDLTINDYATNDQFNINNNSFERDLAFIRKHATDADPNLVYELLDAQMNNSNRLEIVMCEVLKIPNALELIKEFKKGNSVVVGEKRSANDLNMDVTGDSKKKKTDEANAYLNQIQDMFPDADRLFLISECQHLKNDEDCSRFINTVMISGVYPKKGEVDLPVNPMSPPIVEINDREFRVNDVSSDEEGDTSSSTSLSSTGTHKSFNNSYQGNAQYPVAQLNNSGNVSEIIDITANTENSIQYIAPDQETLEMLFNSENDIKVEVKVNDAFPVSVNTWETSLDQDVDYYFQNQENAVMNNSVNEPAGAFAEPETHNFMSDSLNASAFNATFDDIQEKSLAEIIEGGRCEKHGPFGPNVDVIEDFQQPSTSKEKFPDDLDDSFINDYARDLNSEAVATTSKDAEANNFAEYVLTDESDEASKVTEVWLNEQMANLMRIFPTTDPSYLREEVMKMNMSTEAMNAFVIAKLEHNDMPTRAEYEKKREMEELQNRYTKNFSIEDFLKAVPDPWTYFSNGNRNCAKYKKHSLCYLKSAFKKHYVRDIIDTFNKNNCNLYESYKCLKKGTMKMRGTRRSDFECNSNRPTTIDIQFLQEVAFIENEGKIKDFIESEKVARQLKFEEAKRTGSLLECQCCFDTEVMVEDTVYCPKDHSFCKDCVIKSVEVEMGNGKSQFECLANCDEKFTLACLQNVLKPELFSKVIQANQMEEIRAAEIEDLVQCPFCNYATIMPPEEKVMTCLNPECLKESCRLCKELNHIPLRCDEVEKSEDVKMRTFIENKMTEALVRTCYKCGKKFVKEDGCNKMTCTCGAKMCYVCRKPVSDYSHFNGQGGTEYHKCPLYSTNDELHVDLVREIGEQAKAEILQANPQGRLLHDPTVNMPEKTHDRPMPGTNNGHALNVGLRAVRGLLNEPATPPVQARAAHHHQPRRLYRGNLHGINRRHQSNERRNRDEDNDLSPLAQRHRHYHHYHHYHHHHHHH